MYYGYLYDHIAAEMEQEYKDGVEDGIEQGKIEIAKKMFESGLEKEIIAKCTDIEIRRLDEILTSN